MIPLINQFPNEHFYDKKVVNAQNVSSDDYNINFNKFSCYQFLDISQVKELRYKGKAMVESAAILFLLQQLCAGIFFYSIQANRVYCLLQPK